MTAMLRFVAIVGACFAFFTASVPTVTVAQETAPKEQVKRKFKDTIHVVQPKPVLQKMRFELAPRLGMTLNDSVTRNYKVGVNANFHILESLYVGGIFEWYDFGGVLGGTTDIYQQVQNQTGTVAESAVLNWFGGLELGYVPFWGKFALFDSTIAFYDFAITAGGGAINSESLAAPVGTAGGGGTVSLSGRIFLNKWIAMTLEVRDIIFLAELVGAPGSLTNVVTAGLGVGLFLPTNFEYSEKIIEVPGT